MPVGDFASNPLDTPARDRSQERRRVGALLPLPPTSSAKSGGVAGSTSLSLIVSIAGGRRHLARIGYWFSRSPPPSDDRERIRLKSVSAPTRAPGNAPG